MKRILSLLLIIVSVVVFMVFIRPQYENVRQIRNAVLLAQRNLETASKLSTSRDELISKYSSISKTDLDNLKTFLPDNVDNIRLIIQINSLATKNGLSLLRNVDYQTDQNQTTTAGQNTETVQRSYGEFAISFQTSGQYKNFLTFIADLEQDLRLVDVTKVEFAPTQQGNQQTVTGGLTYKVTLKTYWLKQ